jgi:hypothetical protein
MNAARKHKIAMSARIVSDFFVVINLLQIKSKNISARLYSRQSESESEINTAIYAPSLAISSRRLRKREK